MLHRHYTFTLCYIYFPVKGPYNENAQKMFLRLKLEVIAKSN
jgi:hypothetical protein